MAKSNVLKGGCHCGNLSLSFITALSPSSFNPRACDCSFCTKHGAMYASDPSGRLQIDVKRSDALGKYQQGSETADLLFCSNCGVLVAVIWEEKGRVSGAVNVRCLNEYESFGKPVIVSPQKLSKDEKTARWGTIWTKDVQISISDA